MSQALAADAQSQLQPSSHKIEDRRICELSETGSMHTPPDTSGTPPDPLSVVTSSESASDRFDPLLAAKTGLLLGRKNSQNNGSQLNSPNTQCPIRWWDRRAPTRSCCSARLSMRPSAH